MYLLIAFLLGMSLVDSLNPFSIAVHIFLLGVLKNTNRIALYVLGILVVYFVGGIVIFTGLSAVFDQLAQQFAAIPIMVLYILELVLGIVLLIVGINEYRKGERPRQVVEMKDVSAWTLILLGAGGTLSDLPTAIPYLGFIAKMTEMNIGILLGCGLLLIYNLFYIMPLLIIWALFVAYKDKIRERMQAITAKIDRANKTITVIFCVLIGVVFIADSVLYFLGYPIPW